MRRFFTSKVAIAQRLAGGLSTGGRWCVISFNKEHYLPLLMLRLCKENSWELAGLGIDSSS